MRKLGPHSFTLYIHFAVCWLRLDKSRLPENMVYSRDIYNCIIFSVMEMIVDCSLKNAARAEFQWHEALEDQLIEVMCDESSQ